MSSIFTKIVNREIPAYIIAEDDKYLAFLDINPLAKGHTLVIPKKEVDYIFDLDDETLTGLWLFAKRVAKAIDQYTKDVAIRTGVAVVGLDVPHAHIHLVPISNVADMNFAKPKLKLDPKEFESIAEGIRSFLKK
ncbi:MAG: HIT family protein [Bacteroidales bacterium]|jgi:histidine triad (HIT) family protein|nr:HIT family protein [Bacteroidales bacterium]MDI9574893.1 HIT family protein [Bacteroidota bacterium]MDD3755609.1 HIT family protein [Bacteroidales bacterium]MDY0400533.1 HIT family protein [Bacteroidales bacterium]HHW59992.1 HIT family protein [Bacteroidales bacterium]